MPNADEGSVATEARAPMSFGDGIQTVLETAKTAPAPATLVRYLVGLPISVAAQLPHQGLIAMGRGWPGPVALARSEADDDEARPTLRQPEVGRACD